MRRHAIRHRGQRHRRPHRWAVATALLTALCGLYVAVAWWTIFSARIGPVIAVIDQSAGMGIHSGDVLGIAALAAAALAGLGAVGTLERARG